MYNETYDEYIRSILGYPPVGSYNSYQDYNRNNFETRTEMELEKCYPEIYKIVYPMVTKKCSNTRGNLTNEDIENMTDEIYYALEERNEIQLNINLTNDVRTTETTNERTTKVADKKPEVKVTETTEEKRETRQINRGLRDLIKILLIRELLNRPGRPGRPGGPHNPRPPMPGPGGPGGGPGPRPPIRPPMRPPFGQRSGMMPFGNDFETSSFDIFEY